MGTQSQKRQRQWVIEHDQHPDVLIERHRATSMHPEVHAAYARKVREKAESDGLVHRDVTTGYLSRFHPGKPPANAGSSAE